MNWIKRLFGMTDGKKAGEELQADKWWDVRMAALQSILGPSEDMVFHAVQPLFLGGFADVVEFRKCVNGSAYVTSDLIGENGQQPNVLGNYELMICTREKSDWAANVISRLAKYTLEAVLEPGQTMDIGTAVPAGSTVSAFMFSEPEVKQNKLNVNGVECGLLLCIGILPDELAACMSGRTEEVLSLLKQRAIFPFTDLKRASVLEAK